VNYVYWGLKSCIFFKVDDLQITGRTKQNFTPLLFNCTGKAEEKRVRPSIIDIITVEC
jgi:hypothetical protein